MAALLFAVPVLLFYIFIKKRGPSGKEFTFWLLFFIPFGLMIVLWIEGESIQKFWLFYLFFWFFALGTLFQKSQ